MTQDTTNGLTILTHANRLALIQLFFILNYVRIHSNRSVRPLAGCRQLSLFRIRHGANVLYGEIKYAIYLEYIISFSLCRRGAFVRNLFAEIHSRIQAERRYIYIIHTRTEHSYADTILQECERCIY